jgi:hypothetical protein
MRRATALAALFLTVSGALGCKHVAGVCDCAHDPANSQLNTGGGNPYPTVGAPIQGVASPEKMPAPAGLAK